MVVAVETRAFRTRPVAPAYPLPIAIPPLRIAILAAGAAGMICGSCLRDNALAVALNAKGHEAFLVPLYTPLRTDTPTPAAPAEAQDVFYGGINVYLQHASWLFRRTPRFVDWLLDRPGLLRAAGNMGAGTPPAKLAGMTRDIVRGHRGHMAKELSRLVDMLRQLKPDIVSLPNLMFAGIAEELRARLNVPVVVELTGEDIFLEAMAPADQADIQKLLRATLPHVSGFIATSAYYTGKMAAYLGVPTERIATIPPGVPEAFFAQRLPPPAGPLPRVGHLARIDPPKGLDIAQAAMDIVNTPAPRATFHYAGWDAPHHRAWHAEIRKTARHPGTYHGELDLAGKLAFLDTLTLFLAPAPYPEPKALYVIEAMARGRPVVAAGHGAFPETLGETGVLVPPKDPAALAGAVAALLAEPGRMASLGQAACERARASFTAERMADAMLAFYQSLL